MAGFQFSGACRGAEPRVRLEVRPDHDDIASALAMTKHGLHRLGMALHSRDIEHLAVFCVAIGCTEPEQLAALESDHPPEPAPKPGAIYGGIYVAAVDVAGADEQDPEGILSRVAPFGDQRALGR